MKTRTTRKSVAKTTGDAPDDGETALPPTDADPPLLTILPKDLSPDARIVTLPSPASNAPCRYLLCPDQGAFEFTRVCAAKNSPSSWLLAPDRTTETPQARTSSTDISQGYCIEKPDLHIATPIDVIFLLLPYLAPQEAEKQMFLSLDDHVDAWSERTRISSRLLLSERTRDSVTSRVAAICDTVDAGDEKMYKLSEERLAREILGMAQRVVKTGLPASMEDKIVQEGLKLPAMPIKDDAEGQAPEKSSTELDDKVSQLLRLRTAISFILESYIEPILRERVRARFTGPSSVFDFDALDARLAHLESLRKEAQALRSITDNISRKRSHAVDDEVEEMRAEKRRKKEEEELKKKSQSRASKQLAKVNTSGMKKMSSFFAKKT